MSAVQNIAIVGSGNIAGFLALKFHSKQFNITQIISTNTVTGRVLADKVNAKFSTEYHIAAGTDMVLLCVPDSHIADCTRKIQDTTALVCHCAGGITSDVLQKFRHYGVFYPLQSFSQKHIPDIRKIPFLIEANTGESLFQLKKLAERLDANGIEVNSEDRLHYHLAAVFINNFTNAMVLAAHDLTDHYRLDYHLLLPLLEQTFEKLKTDIPLNTQTGPARRKDTVTMKRHLELLKDTANLEDIYAAISHYISGKFNP